jgi:hypothetical protein
MNISKYSSFFLRKKGSLRKIIFEHFSVSKNNTICAEAAKLL